MKLLFILLATFLTARGKPDQKTLGMQLVRLYSGSNTGYKRLELIEVINFKKEEGQSPFMHRYRMTILAGMMDCSDKLYDVAPDQCRIDKVGYCYGRFQEDTSIQLTYITFMLCPGFNRDSNPIEFEFDIDPTYPITFKMAEKSIAEFNKSFILRKVERGTFQKKKEIINYVIHLKAMDSNEWLYPNLTNYHCELNIAMKLWFRTESPVTGKCIVGHPAVIDNKMKVGTTLKQTRESVDNIAVKALEILKKKKGIKIMSFVIKEATSQVVKGIKTDIYMTITYCPLKVIEFCNLRMDCLLSSYNIPWRSFFSLESTCTN